MAARFKTYEKKAMQIIKKNNYMVLATIDGEGMPWASAVSYVFDENYDFYFLSAVDSRHGENLIQIPKVAFEIFDSRQSVGNADGVQAEGRASIVAQEELRNVIKIYVEKFFPDSEIPAEERYPPENYGEAAEFKFFKIKILKLFVTGRGSVLNFFEGSDERRVEVDPEQLSESELV